MRIITIEELLLLLGGYSHRELHVHHTWKPSHKDFNGSNGLDLQRNMRNYHVNTRGWSDIAQHVTLLPDGTFVTGRDFASDPASIKGHNSGAFCVEMVGTFDVGNDVFGGKQKDSMLRLARFFFDKGKYIRFHRENAPKTCPGTSIDKATFMADVKSYGVKINGGKPKEEPKVIEIKFDKSSAEKVIAVLSATYHASSNEKVKAAAHYAADELRKAVGIK
jgi:hypothetical protein